MSRSPSDYEKALRADDELEMMLDPPRTNTNGRIGRDLVAPELDDWHFKMGVRTMLWLVACAVFTGLYFSSWAPVSLVFAGIAYGGFIATVSAPTP